jgi:ABC-type branched-subunit amino acid transport system substrate-binding protein
MEDHDTSFDRRRVLQVLGTTGIAGIAGCIGDGNGNGNGNGNGDDTGDDDNGDNGGGGDNPIKVGLATSFTGQYAWLGNQTTPGAKLAAQLVNNQGGIDGRNIEVVTADTRGSSDAALTAIRNLINSEEVDFIVGPSSLVYKAVFDLFEENEVPSISPLAGTTWLNERGGEWVYRTVPSDDLGAAAVGVAAADEQYNGMQSYGKMSVLVEDSPGLLAWLDPVISGFENTGGTVTYSTEVSPNNPSYDSLVSRTLESDPEIIFVGTRPEIAGKIVNTAFEQGYEGNYAIADDASGAFEDADPKLVNGTIKVLPAQSEKAQEEGRIDYFQSKYEEEIGGEIPGTFTSKAFDATLLGLLSTLAASQDGEITGQGIMENIKPVANPPGEVVSNFNQGAPVIKNGDDTDFQGTGGPIDFDDYGNVTAPYKVLKLQDGTWSKVTNIPADVLTEAR